MITRQHISGQDISLTHLLQTHMQAVIVGMLITKEAWPVSDMFKCTLRPSMAICDGFQVSISCQFHQGSAQF